MSGAAWFVDGSYAYKCWRNAAGTRRLDYTRFRKAIEDHAGEHVSDAYYFNSNNDPPSTAQNGFHAAISKRPPEGPGMRVKLGSLQHKRHYWPDHLGGGAVVHPNNSSEHYETTSQKEVDVLLAFYLTLSYQTRGWQRLYLVAGDRDFTEPVRRLVEDEGVDVTIFGVRGGQSVFNGKRYYPSIADSYDALSQAIYFEDIIDDISMEDAGQIPSEPTQDLHAAGIEEIVNSQNA